ncbi:hypothetical protein AAFC00_001708 [Neodothiora populina]|uniref:Uncharacterized protein n=1 Tax=Neodothiora populina TaxID=2781224 RepID=A0ABR3PQV9_9PEZI
MLSHTVGIIAALAAGTSAFLLPPGVSSDMTPDREVAATIIDTNTQAIKLGCPDCVFPLSEKKVAADGDGDLFWIQGGSTDIIFNLTVSEDGKALMIDNKWQVWPMTLETLDFPTVGGIKESLSIAEAKSHPEQVNTMIISGAGITVDEEPISGTGDRILKLHYQIISLEEHPVTVDGVEIQVLQGGDGSLMIISLNNVPNVDLLPHARPLQPPTTGVAKGCGNLPASLCKMKNIIESKLGHFKQGNPAAPHRCGGRPRPHKMPGHIRPHLDFVEGPEGHKFGDGEGSKHHHDHPHPHDHDGWQIGRPQEHERRAMALISAIVSTLMPLIAGVVMGFCVSVIGLAVGRFVSFMWIRYRRQTRGEYESVRGSDAEDDEDVVLEKGVIVLEQQTEEPLPVYEAAPAYEEAQPEHK